MSFGGLGRRRRKRHLNAEVNIINLVDVVLVLLIIFMITAPMMQGAVEIELPRATAASPAHQDANMVVTVMKNGKIRVGDGNTMDIRGVVSTYQRMVAANPRLVVTYRLDANASVGDAFDLVEALRAAGVSQATFITKPVR